MLTDEIVLTAYFTDEPSKVVIHQVKQGGEGYEIFIDNYRHGMLLERQGEWMGYYTTGSWLMTEDLSVLVETITSHPNYQPD